jgi:16S rRNA (uracil1498-N3)-methyltransferase
LPADAIPAFLYVAPLPAIGERLELSPEDAHYVTRVCRAREGDRFRATDGAGGLAVLRVERVRPGTSAIVEKFDRHERGSAITLLCGAPEGGRADWLIEKLAELGVAAFHPVDCERASWGRAAARTERWSRLALAALRQSMSFHLMEILPVRPLGEALASLPTGGERRLAEGSGARFEAPSTPSIRIGAVGPAPGFGVEERERLLAAGFIPTALGPSRLRTETAAVTLAGAWAVSS